MSKVKSSNGRYVNMETNDLRKRHDRFGGLAILTTSQRGVVNPACPRYLAYDVQFTFPDAGCAPSAGTERGTPTAAGRLE
jgi:hypothetical protein